MNQNINVYNKYAFRLQWYKENKKLKRESIALRNSLMPASDLDKIHDEIDGEDTQSQDELEELRSTVQGK